MFSLRRYTIHAASRRGFSLVELSVVIAILSVVAVFGLEAAASFLKQSSGSLTKERLHRVDEAVNGFFKVNGRLPCPSVITLTPDAPSNYGLEDCSIAVITGTTLGGGVVVGAVPFRTLNIPQNLSIDGFNDKIYYVVTKNLTAAGTANGQFGKSYTAASPTANDGMGGIEVRSGILEQPCSTSKCQILANPTYDATTNPKPDGAAYLLFSSGADRRGAVSMRGDTQPACANTSAISDKRIDSQNCVFGSNTIRGYMNVGGVASTIPYNVFYNNRYNAGLNMVSYFDDYVVWRAKAKLL